MKRHYVLAPEAAEDLAAIWRYIKRQSNLEMGDRVESAIRERIVFLARNPGAGHWRKDLTDVAVRFFPVYSYLIVYRPGLSLCRLSRFYMVAEMSARFCGSGLRELISSRSRPPFRKVRERMGHPAALDAACCIPYPISGLLNVFFRTDRDS